MKLFLGCGPLPIHSYHSQFIDDSWVFIDLYVNDPKIVKMDARDLEYNDGEAEEIYSSHLLEHMETAEVLPALAEWWRVLKRGGKLRLNVPDVEWAAKCLLGQEKSSYFDTPRKMLEIFYGNQSHEGEFHKTGFTDYILRNYLEMAGFIDIEIKKKYEAHDMGCLLATAEKP